jgi:hypothetical protein
MKSTVLVFALVVSHLLSFSTAHGATEAASVSGLTKIQSPKPTNTQILLKDGAMGLGVGALAGLSFMMIGGAPGTGSGAAVNNEALFVGLAAGVLGGISFGVWEIKHQQTLKLSVSPEAQAREHLVIPAKLTATFEY